MPLGTDPFGIIFNNMLHICKLRFLIVMRLRNLMKKKVKYLRILRTMYQNSVYLCSRNQEQLKFFMLFGLKNITTVQLNNNQQQNNQNHNNQVPMVIPLDQQVR